MLDLLEPDWNLNGKAAAEDLQSVESARRAPDELNPATSALRSRLLRALPTTMALVALQRPSRADLGVPRPLGRGLPGLRLRAGGAHQLTTDDLRDPGDAMANLRQDSVVSNAMSADTEFVVNHREVELARRSSCVARPTAASATSARRCTSNTSCSPPCWWLGAEAGPGRQADIAAVTGDDAAMRCSVSAPTSTSSRRCSRRGRGLEREFLVPLDELGGRSPTPSGTRGAPPAPGREDRRGLGPVQARLRAVPGRAIRPRTTTSNSIRNDRHASCRARRAGDNSPSKVEEASS